jgi:putative transposase
MGKIPEIYAQTGKTPILHNHKMEYSENYARNLPHILPNGSSFFITACLKGSIPKEIITQLQIDLYAVQDRIRLEIPNDIARYKLEISNAQKRHFGNLDKYFDTYTGGFHWLKQPEIAQILADTFHFWNHKGYELLAYTIMSNHFHLLFDTQGFNVHPTTIMTSIKRFSAKNANTILNRTGITFWQEESYDRRVRNERELLRIINYILQNPVKANLAERWQDYPFTWLNEKYLDTFP